MKVGGALIQFAFIPVTVKHYLAKSSMSIVIPLSNFFLAD
jgi:hypothetical protein